MFRWISGSMASAFLAAALLLSLLTAAPTRRANAAPTLKHETIRFYSAAELLGVQQSVFETLFLKPWEAEHWEYPLDAEVTGRGIYTGKNQYGQPFELHVRVFAPVDFEKAGLPPASLEWARNNRLAYRAVIGELAHGDVRVSVHGRVITTTEAAGRSSTRFWLANTTTPEPPRIEIRPEDLVWHPRQRREWVLTPAPIKGAPGDIFACVAACTASRDQTIQTANNTFDSRIATANAIRNAQVVAANQTYQNALTSADNTRTSALATATTVLLACDAGCLLLPPGADVACAVACTAAHVAQVAFIQQQHNDAVALADQNRVTAIHLADKTYNTTYDAEAEMRDDAISQARAAYSSCVNGCFPPEGQPGGGGPVRFVLPE